MPMTVKKIPPIISLFQERTRIATNTNDGIR